MSETFVTADLHFSHQGMTHFTKSNGERIRPWDTIEEMNAALVKNFNDTVKEHDKCYVLGDVCINRRGLELLDQLHCKNLVLVKGNHDVFRLAEYTKYFRDIRSYQVMNGMILTHIPIHPGCLYERFSVNVHGHLHTESITKTLPNGDVVIDPQYYCVCVEQTQFKPLSIDEVKANIIERGGVISSRNGNS